MKKRDLLAGTGAIAAAFAIFTAADVTSAPTAPALEPEQIIAVDSEGTGVVLEEKGGALEVAPNHLKWGIAAAFGTLIGGAISILGFNRILNWLSTSRKVASQAASAAARAPGKAARATIDGVSRVFDAPGRVVARTSILAVGALLAFALIDVSWKASLLVGGGAMIWSAVGWRKRRMTLQKVHVSTKK